MICLTLLISNVSKVGDFMGTSIKVKMNATNKILAKRHLTGEGQIEFTKDCAREMNNFVPFRTGRLKDGTVELGKDFVKYNAKYASKQYYRNKGTGTQGESIGGIRGKMWDRKMWIAKGKEILNKIAKFCGGRT